MDSHFGNDESCYVEWFHKFMGELYPQCYSTSHFWGAAVLWLPAGFLAKGLSFFTPFSFTEWALPLIGLTSFLHWAASLFIVDNIIQRSKAGSDLKNPIWTLAILSSLPILLFIFRQNFMSHSGEVLLTSLFFYYLLEKRFFWAIFFATFLFLTRLNDVFVFFALCGALFEGSRHWTSKQKRWVGIALLCGLGLSLFVFYRIAFVVGYNRYLLKDVVAGVQWKGVGLAFFDWKGGLLTQGFLWLFFLAFQTFRLRSLSWLGRGIWAWTICLLLLYVSTCVFWGVPETRYLTASCIAGYIALFSQWENFTTRVKRGIKALVGLTAAWNGYFFLVAVPPVLRYWHELHQNEALSDLWVSILMLGHPQRVLEVIVGLSPIGFSLFSWFQFSGFENFTKYALKGASLWCLSASSGVALLVALRIVLLAARRTQSEVPTAVKTPLAA